MPATTADRSPPVSGSWRRGRDFPLWAHAVALALVLLAALALSRPGVAFTSDEGAAILQARVLEDSGDWIYEYPLAEIDPEGRARPFLRGDLGTKGLAPYARHPIYPLVLATADRVAGATGMALTSVAGTLVAALAAALLARRFGRGLDRWALWVCGVASPLFFDAFVILGHSLAAAAAGLAALAACVALERAARAADGGPASALRAAALPTLGLVMAVVAAAALRSEGAFVGPALALGVGAAWWRRTVPTAAAAVLALASVGATAVTVLAERVALRGIIGERLPTIAEASPSNWLAGRLEGIGATWFEASYGASRLASGVLVLATVAVALAAVVQRRRPDARSLVVGCLVAAAAGYAVRVVLGPPWHVPGLAIAFPVGWGALWLLTRDVLARPATRLVSVSAVVVVVGVVLTQYARGGGVEWGGRYFAVALPLAVPPLTAALAAVGRRADRRVARAGLVAGVVVSLFVAATALRALRLVHEQTDEVLDAMVVAAAEAGSAPGLERPVVVAWNPLLPQIAYRDFDDYEWVVPRRPEVAGYLDRLADEGVERVVLVTPDSRADLPGLPGWREVGRVPGPVLQTIVLERDRT
jgi:hypothetical protein